MTVTANLAWLLVGYFVAFWMGFVLGWGVARRRYARHVEPADVLKSEGQ